MPHPHSKLEATQQNVLYLHVAVEFRARSSGEIKLVRKLFDPTSCNYIINSTADMRFPSGFKSIQSNAS
jgi:hypothetical protein